MRAGQFYRHLIKTVFQKPIIMVGTIASLLTVLGGFGSHVFPTAAQYILTLLWLAPLIVLLITVIIGFIRAPYLIHKEQVEENEQQIKKIKSMSLKEIYAMDANARIDRAYRIFHKLSTWGDKLVGQSHAQRPHWDKEVLGAMAGHCNQSCIGNYLINTGRHQGVDELPDDKFKKALDFVKQMIENDFHFCIKEDSD
jgi:Na+(H+)/acetate symporter ActP